MEREHIPCMGPVLPVRSWILNSKASGGSFNLCLVTQYFFPGSGHHIRSNPWPPCLQNPPWFFLCFPGSEEVRAWDELGSSFILELSLSCGELWIVWREAGACLCTSTSCKAQCLSYRINCIYKMWARGIAFLTQRKENRNIAGNKIVKKNSEETMTASVHCTHKVGSKLNTLFDFLLK